MNRLPDLVRAWSRCLHSSDGSAIVEFAISLPLLVVFIVGIFDFMRTIEAAPPVVTAATVVSPVWSSPQPSPEVWRS